MKKLIGLIFFAAMAIGAATAQNAAINGFCTTGGVKVSTSGSMSSTTVQASYPRCLVSVYATGTTTLASIFSDTTGTPLANPFTANTNASWLFYSTLGVGVDIVMSGGSPISFPSPFTLTNVVSGSGAITTSINTLFGSIGLVGGANVTITPIGGNSLRIDSTSSGSGSVVGTLNAIGSFSNSTTTKPTNGTVDSAGNQFTFPSIIASNNGGPFSMNQSCTNQTQLVPASAIFTCNFWDFLYTINPDLGQSGYNASPIWFNYSLDGRGMNPGTNGSINHFQEAGGGGPIFNTTVNRRGNHSGGGNSIANSGGGDLQGFNISAVGPAGAQVGADEGLQGLRINAAQITTVANGSIASGGTTGSSFIQINGGVFGDGSYVYDLSRPLGTGVISARSTNSDLNSPVQTMTGITMTPSTAWGTLDSTTVSYAGGPVGLYQNTAVVTATITLGVAPASPGAFATGPMACSGHAYELVNVTNVGSVTGGKQVVTFTSRNGWDSTQGVPNTATCMQGGNLINSVFIRTSEVTHIPVAYPVVGAIDSTHLVPANCDHGICNFLGFNPLPLNSAVTFFPMAEVIGSHNGAAGAAELGFNNAGWVNGDTVIQAYSSSAVVSGIFTNITQSTPLEINYSDVPDLISPQTGGYIVNDVGPHPGSVSFYANNHRTPGDVPAFVFGGQGNYKNLVAHTSTPISGGCMLCAGIDDVEGATFTASLSGSTITVTAISSGFILPLAELNGAGISPPCEIGAYVEGTGTKGGIGQYTTSCGGTIGSETMTTTKGYYYIFNTNAGSPGLSLRYNSTTKEADFNFANGLADVVLLAHSFHFGDVFQSSVNQQHNLDFGGSCAMAANTTCAITINTTYQHPLCMATEQSSGTPTVGSTACSVTTNTVTVTATTANSSTWGIFVFGNPN